VGRRVKPSGRLRVLQKSIPLSADAPAFGSNFLACFFEEHHHKSNEVEWREQSIKILPVDSDLVIGRRKLLAELGESLLVRTLPPLVQQIGLKRVIGQHDKDDLVGHQGEGQRNKIGKVPKAFNLMIPFLGEGTQMVLLPGSVWVLYLFGIAFPLGYHAQGHCA
jgi:hypothetical protein